MEKGGGGETYWQGSNEKGTILDTTVRAEGKEISRRSAEAEEKKKGARRIMMEWTIARN